MTDIPGAGAVDADSPCVRVCKYNERQECFGCFRTSAEVRGWTRMTSAERAAATAQLDDRRTAYWASFTTTTDRAEAS